MAENSFRKLDIHLPPQPVANLRSWSIAGWLFAFAIMLGIVYSYKAYNKRNTAPIQVESLGKSNHR